MKKRTILFPFDEKHIIARKVADIENLIGANNIEQYGLECEIPEITIRCSKKEWKEIKFICGLCKVYY